MKIHLLKLTGAHMVVLGVGLLYRVSNWNFCNFRWWTFNPVWHGIRKHEKWSPLEQPKGNFYKIWWAGPDVNITQFISIFISWQNLILEDIKGENALTLGQTGLNMKFSTFFMIFFSLTTQLGEITCYCCMVIGQGGTLNLNNQLQGKLKLGISDDDVTILPWLPSNIFLVVCMISATHTSYTSKCSNFLKK